MGWIKRMVRKMMEIVPVQAHVGSILSDADFGKEVMRNKVWYRGNEAELSQFYGMTDDLVGNKSFWAASGGNSGIRKMHSGLPAMIVDTIADVAVGDLLGVRVVETAGASVDCRASLAMTNQKDAQGVWDAVAQENGFYRLLGKAVRKALAFGDGAFKISFDADVSRYPIVEFFSADRVRFVYRRGRVAEVVFLQEVIRGRERYVLEEIYGGDGIRYRVIGEDGREVDVDCFATLAMTNHADLRHNCGMNLAVPLIFDENPKHEGRGKSIFDGKIGAFDALDEVLSQWVDALRDGRAQKYIPIGLLPRDPRNGRVMGLSAFQSRFITTEMDMAEGADNSIKVVQPHIDTAAMAESAQYFIQLALQGVLAPATLGMDLKRRDNAEAQREKEKATLYTRGKVIGVLREVVAQVAVACVTAYDAYYGNEKVEYEATVEFGEYAAPDFGSQVETVGKGVQMGVISVENAVEQLYGGSWSEEMKREEVERLCGKTSTC